MQEQVLLQTAAQLDRRAEAERDVARAQGLCKDLSNSHACCGA